MDLFFRYAKQKPSATVEEVLTLSVLTDKLAANQVDNFIADFGEAGFNAAVRKNADLVEAWKAVYKHTNLRKNADYLNAVSEYTSGKIARKYAEKLDLGEEAVLRYYTTNAGYKNFNAALRGETAMTNELIAQEQLMNQALDKLPNSIYNQSDELLYRIENLTNEQINAIYKEGETFISKGFYSSTYSRDAIKEEMAKRDHTVLIKIKGKNGKLIENISSLSSEKEILFKSNTKYKVEHIYSEQHPILKDDNKITPDDLMQYIHPMKEYGQIRIIELIEL